jgi:putative spermidine/putrescine transport system permease protein
LIALGIVDTPVKFLFSFLGMMIGTVQGMMPIAIMMMLSVMTGIDRDLPRAAQTLGARRANQFWLVYLPLSFPGIVAAALVVFVSALGLFVTARLLGGPRDIMLALLIVQQFEDVYDINFAGALSVVLLLSTLLIVFIFDRVLGLSSLMGDAGVSMRGGGSPRRLGRRAGLAIISALGSIGAALGDLADRIFPARRRLRRDRPGFVLWAAVLLIVFFIAAPTFILIPTSITQEPVLSWPPVGFTLEWYAEFFTDPEWRDALVRSIVIAIGTSLLAMAIGIPAAYVLSRQRIPLRTPLMTIILMPLVLPSIIIAVGLYYLYSKLGLLYTSAGLVLGHTVFALPYVVVTTMAALRNYDERLDHAAWTLGATRLTTFRRISFPLMKAGMASAFLFSFVQSFDELSVALFVSGDTAPTLPKRLWSETLYKLDPSIAAAASIIVLVVAIPIFLSQIISSRRARARQ